MYRCLVRSTKTLRRGANASKSKRSTLSFQPSFRKYTSISRNFRRHKPFRTPSMARPTTLSTPVASILLAHRHFNPDSTNPHQANDTIHSGSIGQFADGLFEAWQRDPNSVDKSWREYFEKYYGYFTSGAFIKDGSGSGSSSSGSVDLQSGDVQKMISDAANLLKLVRAYQAHGHFTANLDPLGILKQGVDRRQFKPDLITKEHWGFSDADYDRPIHVGDHSQFVQLMGKPSPFTLREVEDKLRSVYCNTIGYQYMHIANHDKNQFMRTLIERENFDCSKEEKIRILDRLVWAEEFEAFLDVKYPAQKRFGINGAESFVPLLKEVIDEGARLGVDDFVIGMPHRGRLLFLATVMRKPLWQILYEFRGLAVPWEQIEQDFVGYDNSGDVKYHLGHSLDRSTPDGKQVHISLFPNPSHLEAVDPVIMGKTRAKQFWNGDAERKKTCAIIIHGDASFSGQGVVYESMALTDLPQYSTGGVIHVVVNNQIGFTTDAQVSRSTPYCTDVGKAAAAPILHVNGDDPEAVVKCAKMAMRFRQQFSSDTIIDMLCFRRYGHNEGDEPMFTQPQMYKVITEKMAAKDVVVEKYKKKLLAENVLDEAGIREMEQRIREILSDNYERSANAKDVEAELKADWMGANWSGLTTEKAKSTAISRDTACYVADALSPSALPEDFVVHKKLNKILGDRANSVVNDNAIDWGTAEQLAYGSLLLDGVHVRISGQDVERGTFSHRHCVVHDQGAGSDTRRRVVPLAQNLKNRTSGEAMGDRFQISNSNLSEFGVLGFEYGYSCESPNSLVIWEAQFGDFANGAMVIFDQFVSSAETKWLRQSGLVVLLPHGYEGGGPEHSSARMERYLQMVDDDESEFVSEADQQKVENGVNWHCVNITAPSNLFHALRRQIHRTPSCRKPLIAFTPKFGLRHPLATSPLDEFLEGSKGFQSMIPGKCENKDGKKVKKLLFCSGKIWLEIEALRAKEKMSFEDVIVSRVEEIAPFPFEKVEAELKKYPNAKVAWVQEEPKNMGAFAYVHPRLQTTMKHAGMGAKATEIEYIGRKPNASPATGYPQVHKAQMADILKRVFEV